jgi:hypothetical protein
VADEMLVPPLQFKGNSEDIQTRNEKIKAAKLSIIEIEAGRQTTIDSLLKKRQKKTELSDGLGFFVQKKR